MRQALIIDDDLISREVLAMLLESLQVDAHPVETGQEALEWFASAQTSPLDLILLDAQMPGLSGVELIRALRPLTRATIAVISASHIRPDLRSVADVFLLKPIQLESLAELLRDLPSTNPANPENTANKPEIQLDPTSQPPLTPQTPFLDPATFAKLASMMKPAALRQMYTAMADDLQLRLTALEAAIAENDPAEVARTAHAIKGGCAMLGLTRSRNAAAALEHQASQPTPVTADWPGELRELQRALLDLQAWLNANSFSVPLSGIG